MGRDGIEPSTSGLKVQPSHQHARPTTCTHNDLVVHGRAAWWRFEAVSVPKLCQIKRPEAAQLCPPGRDGGASCSMVAMEHPRLKTLAEPNMARSALRGSSACLVPGEDSGVDAPYSRRRCRPRNSDVRLLASAAAAAL